MAAADPTPLVRKIQSAFANGDLVNSDWLDSDKVRGSNTYNECLILQMAINDAGSATQKALEPKIYVKDNYREGCATLKRIVFRQADYSALHADTYARYWHGYVPIASAILRFTGVAGMRVCLRAGVYLSLLILLIISMRAGRIFAPLGGAIALVGATVWALPYYGQNISYAPGDAAVILGITAIIARRRQLSSLSRFGAICTAYGAVIVYLDFLTGQIPTGAGFLFATGYALGSWQADERDDAALRGWRFAIVGLVALIVGAVVSVLFKQALVLWLSGPEGGRHFVNNLEFYTGVDTNGESGLSLYGHAFAILAHHSYVLTHNRIWAGKLLIVGSCIIWMLAGLGAFVSGDRRLQRTTLAFLSVRLRCLLGCCSWRDIQYKKPPSW